VPFYTYTYLRADGSPYYVGKGKGNRAFVSRVGHRPPRDSSRIVVQFWSDEATALAYEVYFIDFWGRKNQGTGILRNLTDGGDGISGYAHTAEHRKKVTETLKKLWKNPEYQRKQAMSRRASWERDFDRKENLSKQFSGSRNPFFGKIHTPEVLLLNSEAHKGLKASAETRAKLSVFQKGKSHSAEHNQRVSEALLGLQKSPLTKQRMRIAALRRQRKTQ
jgi:hypothetical protein